MKIAVPWGHEDGDGGYGGGVFFFVGLISRMLQKAIFLGERVYNRNEVCKRHVEKKLVK